MGRRLIGPSGIKVGDQGYGGRASSPWTGTRFPVASRIGPSWPPALPRCSPSQSLLASCLTPAPPPESTPHPAAPTFHRRPSWHPRILASWLVGSTGTHSKITPQSPTPRPSLPLLLLWPANPFHICPILPAPSTSTTACPISSYILHHSPSPSNTLLFTHSPAHSPLAYPAKQPDRSPVPRHAATSHLQPDPTCPVTTSPHLR